MFDLASCVSITSPELQFLLKRGWRIRNSLLSSIADFGRTSGRTEIASRLFAQVNHSEHLEEFMQVVLAPLRLEHQTMRDV